MTIKQKIASTVGILSALGMLSVGTGFLPMQRSQAATETNAPIVADDTAESPSDTNAPSAPIAGRRGARLDQMAKDLGMTTADLQKDLAAGKPLYQIAAEHGQTYDTLKASRQEALKARLDDMVRVGFMTQEEADQELQKIENMPMPMLGLGHHEFGRGFGMMK